MGRTWWGQALKVSGEAHYAESLGPPHSPLSSPTCKGTRKGQQKQADAETGDAQ